MPELFRVFGFVFYFYCREHEPIHVHVSGKGGMAKFTYDEATKEFYLVEAHHVKAADLKKIRTMVQDNGDIIIRTWTRFFGESDDKDKKDMV